MSAIVQQYQQRILGPEEPVDYSSIVMQTYPPHAIQREAFVGFKVLCTDTQAFVTNPQERMRYLDAQLGILRGKGCLIRETNKNKPDGLWVITFPCPRSQINTALNNLFDVIATLERYYGITRDGLYEINVSGRCHTTEVENAFSGMAIPDMYMSKLVPTHNVMCSIGHIVRINDSYMCLRTRWDLSRTNSTQETFGDLLAIPQMIAGMYHF